MEFKQYFNQPNHLIKVNLPSYVFTACGLSISKAENNKPISKRKDQKKGTGFIKNVTCLRCQKTSTYKLTLTNYVANILKENRHETKRP